MYSRNFLVAIALAATFFSIYSSNASATYVKQTSDLVFNEGPYKFINVQLLNLTPYELKASDLTAFGDHISDKYYDIFAFAPSGIPQTIPALPITDDVLNKDYVNKVTHPYAMPLSWQDDVENVGGKTVADTTIKWTLMNVPGVPANRNVPIKFKIHRETSSTPPRSGTIKIIADVMKEVMYIAKIVYDPASPVTWTKLFIGGGDLVTDSKSFNEKNSKRFDGASIYTSAYVDCGDNVNPAVLTVANSSADADDAAITNQSQNLCKDGKNPNDSAESIVVVSQIIRGQKKEGNVFGNIPMLTITILTATDWNTATSINATAKNAKNSKGATAIQEKLKTLGNIGAAKFAKIVRSFDSKKLKLLRDSTSALSKKIALTSEQENLFVEIANVL